MVPKSLQGAQADAWRCLSKLDTIKAFFLDIREGKNPYFCYWGEVIGCVQEESCDLPTLI